MGNVWVLAAVWIGLALVATLLAPPTGVTRRSGGRSGQAVAVMLVSLQLLMPPAVPVNLVDAAHESNVAADGGKTKYLATYFSLDRISYTVLNDMT